MRQKLGRKAHSFKTSKQQKEKILDSLNNQYKLEFDKIQQQQEQTKQKQSTNETLDVDKKSFMQVSNHILSNFKNIEKNIQFKVASSLIKGFLDDQQFYIQCQDLLIINEQQKLKEFFIQRDFDNIQNILKQYSNEQVIYFHCIISQDLPDLKLEGQSLYITLYSHLNSYSIWKSLSDNNLEIFKTMVSSINRHLMDNQIKSSPYFISLMIEFNPIQSKKLIQQETNIQQFKTYLKDLGFSQQEVNQISLKGDNFLWHQFLEKILKINKVFRTDIISLLSKVQIFQDPSFILDDFQKIFSQRRILLTLLIEKDQIQLPIERLNNVLQTLKDYDVNDVKQVFEFNESNWLRELNKKNSIGNQNLEKPQHYEKYKEIYQKSTQSLNQKDKVSIEQLIEISNKLETVCDDYKHSFYQSMIAAAILSNYKSVIQIHIPTASGKSWIQALIALFWISQNKKVILVVPNEHLKNQYLKQIIQLGPNIQIVKIQDFYKMNYTHEITIVDEYDLIIKNHPFMVNQGKLRGIWDFTITNCYLFSATCNESIIRILERIIGQPAIMEFSSEFEVISGAIQDQGGEIIIYKTHEEKLQALIEMVLSISQHTPVIVFADENDQENLEKQIKMNQIDNFKRGISDDLFDEIQGWMHGVLLLGPNECYGFNTKFKQDSKVLIACDVESESQYLQMRGRSSRSRGILQSTYLVVSEKSKSQILIGMKKLFLKQMIELEQLMDIVFKKRNSKILIETIQEALNAGDQIKSQEDLISIMGEKDFKKLISNLK